MGRIEAQRWWNTARSATPNPETMKGAPPWCHQGEAPSHPTPFAALPGALSLVAVEERDGQTVKLLVRGLRDDLVHDLHGGVLLQPLGDVLAHVLAIARERGGEHLDAREADNAHSNPRVTRDYKCL